MRRGRGQGGGGDGWRGEWMRDEGEAALFITWMRSAVFWWMRVADGYLQVEVGQVEDGRGGD